MGEAPGFGHPEEAPEQVGVDRAVPDHVIGILDTGNQGGVEALAVRAGTALKFKGLDGAASAIAALRASLDGVVGAPGEVGDPAENARLAAPLPGLLDANPFVRVGIGSSMSAALAIDPIALIRSYDDWLAKVAAETRRADICLKTGAGLMVLASALMR